MYDIRLGKIRQFDVGAKDVIGKQCTGTAASFLKKLMTLLPGELITIQKLATLLNLKVHIDICKLTKSAFDLSTTKIKSMICN